jgi:pimeloyl-ACP methyl ester carboxylesterase
LGCTKDVNYVVKQQSEEIEKVILLAPTDMVGWAKTDPKNDEYLAKAKELVANGRGEELVSAECWLDKTPVSAQTYPTICEAGSSADIYGVQEGGALLGRIQQPMAIIYGDSDIGITKIDGNINAWLKRANAIKNANTEIVIVKEAEHSFRGYEDKLTEFVEGFITE